MGLQYYHNDRNTQKRYKIYKENPFSANSENKIYDIITFNKRNVFEFPREKFFTDNEIKELFESNTADGAPVPSND